MALATDQLAPLSGSHSVARRRRALPLSGPGMVAVGLLTILVLAATLGPILWGRDPIEQNLEVRLQGPSLEHPLGTDRYGRDLLARLLVGARWSLAGAAFVCIGTGIVGFAIGALAALGGRLVDLVVSRLIEALMALPGIVMALALATILPASFATLLLALIITGWPPYARIYRALLLRERGAGYVESAVCTGCGQPRILCRHLLPNVLGPTLILATSNFGGVILSLASLSFLGFGVQPPTPEWGVLINEARAYFQAQPWQMVAPGLGIALTVLAVNLLGDALRDRLDPRTRTR